MFDTNSIIGKTKEEATQICGWAGYNLNVIKIDGKDIPYNKQHNQYRITVTIENGLVTTAELR